MAASGCFVEAGGLGGSTGESAPIISGATLVRRREREGGKKCLLVGRGDIWDGKERLTERKENEREMRD